MSTSHDSFSTTSSSIPAPPPPQTQRVLTSKSSQFLNKTRPRSLPQPQQPRSRVEGHHDGSGVNQGRRDAGAALRIGKHARYHPLGNLLASRIHPMLAHLKPVFLCTAAITPLLLPIQVPPRIMDLDRRCTEIARSLQSHLTDPTTQPLLTYPQIFHPVGDTQRHVGDTETAASDGWISPESLLGREKMPKYGGWLDRTTRYPDGRDIPAGGGVRVAEGLDHWAILPDLFSSASLTRRFESTSPELIHMPGSTTHTRIYKQRNQTARPSSSPSSVPFRKAPNIVPTRPIHRPRKRLMSILHPVQLLG